MMGRIIGQYGDEDALSGFEREHLNKMRAIEELGPPRTIYVSHGADGDWFVVEPQVGTMESMAGTPITKEQAVERLIDRNRTVYELTPKLFRNRRANTRIEHLEVAWKPTVYLIAGFLLGALVRSIT